MKYIIIYLISFFLISTSSHARIIYFAEHTIMNSNSDGHTIEANLFIHNPSTFNQRICYPEVLLFYYSVQALVQPVDIRMPPGPLCTLGSGSGSPNPYVASATLYTSRVLPMQPNDSQGNPPSAAITLTCSTLTPGQTLNLVYMLSKTLAGSTTNLSQHSFLTERIGPSNYQSTPAASFGGGDFMGYVFFKGFLNVTDVNPANPGFVTMSGNILKPNSIGGLNAVNVHEFNLNNGKPF